MLRDLLKILVHINIIIFGEILLFTFRCISGSKVKENKNKTALCETENTWWSVVARTARHVVIIVWTYCGPYTVSH